MSVAAERLRLSTLTVTKIESDRKDQSVMYSLRKAVFIQLAIAYFRHTPKQIDGKDKLEKIFRKAIPLFLWKDACVQH